MAEDWLLLAQQIISVPASIISHVAPYSSSIAAFAFQQSLPLIQHVLACPGALLAESNGQDTPAVQSLF